MLTKRLLRLTTFTPVFVLAATMSLATPASASGPTNGTVVPNAAQCSASCAAGQPFDSGQQINVVIPANDTFSSTDGFNNNHVTIKVLECAAPNGVLPTSPTSCDGNTIQPSTVLPSSNGSFTLQAYTLYALPDTVSLGESPSGQPVCGSTAATACVLYIGNDQNDFSQPHLWSQPFLVTANGNDLGANPGDGGTVLASNPSGTVVPNAAQCSASCAAGQPFDSGQQINVVVPANDVFSTTSPYDNNTARIAILECAASNGVLPESAADCDGLTEQPGNLLPNADGSFTYTGYTVFALPDSVSLGEGASSTVTCGNTVATECVLWIGNRSSSRSIDFLSQPHVWSQFFLVKANGNDLGANPGDGTPEVPLAVLLPLTAMALLGGAALIRRRRQLLA